jgi:hypothetical protein
MQFAKLDRYELLFVVLAFFAISLKDLISNLFMAMNEKIKSSFVEPSFGVLALIVLYGFYCAGLVNLKSVFFTYFFLRS